MTRKANHPGDQDPNVQIPEIIVSAESVIRDVIRDDERAAGYLSMRETKPGRVTYRTDSKVHAIQTVESTGEGTFLAQRDSHTYAMLSNPIFAELKINSQGQRVPVGLLQMMSYRPGFVFSNTTRRGFHFLNHLITEHFEDGKIRIDDKFEKLIPLRVTLEDWIKFTNTTKESARKTFREVMGDLLSIHFRFVSSPNKPPVDFVLSSHTKLPRLKDDGYTLYLDPYGVKQLFDPGARIIMIHIDVFGANIQRFPCSIDLVVECYSWLYQYVLEDDTTFVIPMRKLIERLPGIPNPEDPATMAALKAAGMASPAMLTRQTILPIMEAARHQFKRGHLRWDIIPTRDIPLNMDKHVYENELRRAGRLMTFRNGKRRTRESITYEDAINGYFIGQLPTANAEDIERWREYCWNQRHKKALGQGGN